MHERTRWPYLAHGHPRDCRKLYPRTLCRAHHLDSDGGDTIRFLADQGPGIDDKERAFDFGVTSANSKMKRYIRGTGAGFPMVQEYLENAGGAVSIEDNMGSGTVVTVSLDPKRVQEIERAGGRGAAVRPGDGAAHISPAGSFCAAAHGNAADAAPRGADTAARNASYTRAPGDIDVDAAKHARARAAGGSGCSSNAAGDGGTGWPANGLSAVPTGISISVDAATGVWPAVPAAVPAGISAAVPADAAAAVQPLGPADASAALPTVASKVFNSKCRRCRVLNNQQLK